MQIARQSGRSIGLELTGDEPILRAQERAHQRRRTGIAGELPRRIECRHSVEIGGEHTARRLGDSRIKQPANAVAPFPAARRLRPGEIIEAGTGMGVDDPKGRRLLAQMHEQARQHGMLENIGKIAGVKSVTIAEHGLDLLDHAAGNAPAATAQRLRAIAVIIATLMDHK